MDDTVAKGLVFCILAGIVGTIVGCWQCISGHNFAVAAQHEFTAAGRITGFGRHGAFMYKFPVNGVMMDDYSAVCRTPLAPGACYLNESVLVYYSFQPFSNSRLEDFSVASANAYRIGKPALAIGLPLFFWSTVIMVILSRKNKSKVDPDPEDRRGRSKSGDVPDVIHIVPGE
jgi:hypothetical protein